MENEKVAAVVMKLHFALNEVSLYLRDEKELDKPLDFVDSIRDWLADLRELVERHIENKNGAGRRAVAEKCMSQARQAIVELSDLINWLKGRRPVVYESPSELIGVLEEKLELLSDGVRTWESYRDEE